MCVLQLAIDEGDLREGDVETLVLFFGVSLMDL